MTRTPTHRLRTVVVAATFALLTAPVLSGTADAAIDPCALLHGVVAPVTSGAAPTVPRSTAPGSTAQPTDDKPSAAAPAPSVAPTDDPSGDTGTPATPGADKPGADKPGSTPTPDAPADDNQAGNDSGDAASGDKPGTDEPGDGSGSDQAGDNSGDQSDDQSGGQSDEGHPAPLPAAPGAPAPTAAPAVPNAPTVPALPAAPTVPATPAIPAIPTPAPAPEPAGPAASPGNQAAPAGLIPPGVLGAAAPLPVACHPGGNDRPYFQKADWLWGAIPSNPVVDGGSAGMVTGLATGDHIANIGDFGVTLRGPGGITAATPRFPVSFSETGAWGPDPFAGRRMPIPPDTPIAPGSDGHLAVADPVTNAVYNLWMAKDGGASWNAGWGAITPLDGDGREINGSSTGAGIARFAAVVRESELAAGVIPHALFFSTNMATPDVFRYPATKTDGSNDDGMPNPIPEGARVQLDPSIDVDALPNLTPAEKTVAKALQTYGAYCGDNGGARMAFLFEYAPDSNGYAANGLTGSYASLANIPFDKLRVLANWDGKAADENPLPAGGQ